MTDPPVTTSSPTKPSKKNLKSKRDPKSPAVLSTPPPLLIAKKANKKATAKNSVATPIKTSLATTTGAALFDDNDFFSFLREDSVSDLKPQQQHRTPLKSGNSVQEQIFTKKRGRPPKPTNKSSSDTQSAMPAAVAAISACGKPVSGVNTSLGDNESLDLTDSDNNSDSNKKLCADEDEDSDDSPTTKCILSTAVENTFQDLINSKNTDTFAGFLLNGKPARDKTASVSLNNTSPNNKENSAAKKEEEEFGGSFVYDIAGVGGGETAAGAGGTDESMAVSGEITIASLVGGEQQLAGKNRKRKQKGVQAASGPGVSQATVGGEKEKEEGAGEESKRVRKNESECEANADSKRTELIRKCSFSIEIRNISTELEKFLLSFAFIFLKAAETVKITRFF